MSNIYGLIGEKLGHSLSPKIHSLIFKDLNIEGYYDLLEVERNRLKDAISGLKAIGAKGVNITIPYKVDIINYIDRLSKEAERIGAINTIAFYEGEIIGYNTDYMGFGMMMGRENISIKGATAVILGTGGASKAVCQYLIDNEINKIIFVSRDIHRAKEKYPDFETIGYTDMENLSNFDIIINCTPVGMHPLVEESPVNKEDLLKFHTAVDLIYNPKETKFLKYASEQGLKTVNGLYMLIGQAVKAEEIWNNVNISTETVERIFNEINIFYNWR